MKKRLALVFIIFIPISAEGPIHGASNANFGVKIASPVAYGNPDRLSQRGEGTLRRSGGGESRFGAEREGEGFGYGDQGLNMQREDRYGERNRRSPGDERFGGEGREGRGLGGDEGFGDDQSFGGDEGFDDDEGFGSDENWNNDEGFADER